jgi:NTP pyrophosphatase (non-canonical NTP hydrolase)
MANFGGLPVSSIKDKSTTLSDLKSMVEQFISERKWEPYHEPKNLAASISIEAAELLELFQWEDPGKNNVATNKQLMKRVKDEVADVMIYVLSMACTLDFDLSTAVSDKISRNREKYPVD